MILLPVAPAIPQETAKAPGAGVTEAATLNLSFDHVDVRTFIKVIGEVSGKRFVVDEAVKGQITVLAPRIPVAEAYVLSLKILESAGCGVVEEDGINRVVPLGLRTTPSAPVIVEGRPVPAVGLVTRVIRLRNTSVGDVRKVMEALAGRDKGGSVAVLETTNHLIITDTADNIRRFEQVVAEIDKPGSGTVSEVYAMKYASADDFVQQYSRAMAAQGQRGMIRDGVPIRAGTPLTLIASPHANSIIMVGPAVEVAEVVKILRLIDVESTAGQGTLHAVFLKYIGADEAAKSLNALLQKTLGKEPKAGTEQRLAIEALASNNSLLVSGSPTEFEYVRSLVDELDRMPQQVMIEVVIAEVGADDSLDVGVELAAINMPSKVGDTVVQGASTLNEGANSLMNAIQSGVFPRGITVGMARGTRVDADGKIVSGFPAALNINALQKKGKVKILSSVPLLSQDNKEASVSVVNNIPVLKSTIQGGSGTSRDVIQNIDRVDVGIQLKLTPHINPSNEVRMVLNPSIEAIIDPGPSGQFTPTIAKRSVSTTVTVPDGRTIVISGLIREDRINTVRRVPFLGSIPIFGFLFRHKVDSVERTNLIIFVTPHVLRDAAAAEAMTRNWSQRTGLSATNATDGVAGASPAP
jgi:general secretion pathway protein D